MTAKCLLSTRFHLMLLSVIVVMTCVPSEATVSSAEKEEFQQNEDTRTPIASRVKSFYDKRSPNSNSIAKHREIKSPSFLENIRRDVDAATFENLQRRWHSGTSAVSVERQAVVSQLLEIKVLRAKVVSGLFRDYWVEEVTTKLFESPQFQQWSGLIIRSFPRASSTAHDLIFSQLVAHYDLQLPKLIVEAKQVKETKTIADRYESKLIDFCISDGLEKGSARVLQNKLLLKWYEETPKVAKYFAVIELRLRLEEIKVDLDSIEASERGTDRTILEKLVALKPYEVEFGRLGLHRVVGTGALLSSPKFSDWKRFVVEDAGLYVDLTLLSTLRQRSVSDCQLLDELFAVGKSRFWEQNQVPSAMLADWLDRGFGMSNILHELELDKSDGQILNSPRLDVVELYLEYLKPSEEDANALIDTWFSNSQATLKGLLQSDWFTLLVPSEEEVAKNDVAASVVLHKLHEYVGGNYLRNMLLSYPNADKSIQRLQRCLLEPSCDGGVKALITDQPVDPVVLHLRFRE